MEQYIISNITADKKGREGVVYVDLSWEPTADQVESHIACLTAIDSTE